MRRIYNAIDTMIVLLSAFALAVYTVMLIVQNSGGF